MTNRKRSRALKAGTASKQPNTHWFPIGVVAVVIVGAVAVLATREPTEEPRPVAEADTTELVETGEVSSMGVPFIETPGGTSGVAEAGGVEVRGATWAMGEVPLEVAVRPTWELVNTGTEPVTLGEPHPEVVAGCRPGPITLGTTTLAPGESTTVAFELAMHEGMDGWHDLLVHVPVIGGDRGEDVLTLNVTGDFV